MVEARFDTTGLTMRLTPEEYRFVRRAMEYVLYEREVRDFRILMMNERPDAEALYRQIRAAEPQHGDTP